MSGRDDEPYIGVPQTISGISGNVPMVIVHAPEPSVTRGVTGLFVPIFLAIFIVAAIYFFFGAWQAAQGLERQKAVTRDAAGIFAYMEDLERQNLALCRSWASTPERVERPNIQAQLIDARRAFDEQCRSSHNLEERLSRRSGASAGNACPSATPAARTAPPLPIVSVSSSPQDVRRMGLDDFRENICRTYRPAPPAVNSGARP